jgi:hypothetical protein
MNIRHRFFPQRLEKRERNTAAAARKSADDGLLDPRPIPGLCRWQLAKPRTMEGRWVALAVVVVMHTRTRTMKARAVERRLLRNAEVRR